MPAKEHVSNKDHSLSRRQKSQAENVAPHEQAGAAQKAQVASRLFTPGDMLQLQRAIGNQAVGYILAHTHQQQPMQAVVQRVVINNITVNNKGQMPTWVQGGKTYHINATTDTSHVTEEGIPKIQYFFQGSGADIRDSRPTKKEQGGSSTKKVRKVKGMKAKKVKTKRVFSDLPDEVQDFIKTNYVTIFSV